MSDLDWQVIRDLIETFDNSTIATLSLEAGDFKLSLQKATLTPAPVAIAAPVPLPAPVATPEPAAGPHPDWVAITSPMVGTFYAAPAPDEPPFTRPGERVDVGQTVCIIEAMKLMNEIEAEVSGRVVEIVASNAQPVEYGQVLMYIDPR
ncbi:MAG: acetyl-CoA carboxylase biotin carboxyl carrier protein [Synechococcaceae cyanobacterium SM2_3_60]|nr:acetyl-CoA carboxylase biotin carboxyl carrier protein [Synechococcaceae cyanobacterium SM2_3_60]